MWWEAQTATKQLPAPLTGVPRMRKHFREEEAAADAAPAPATEIILDPKFQDRNFLLPSEHACDIQEDDHREEH